MIGKWGTSLTFNYASDFACLSDFFKYMFCGVRGYIFSAIKKSYSNSTECGFYQRCVDLQKIDFDDLTHTIFNDVVSGCGCDRYMTLNQFCYNSDGLSRKTSNLKRLNALYVDIDCYSLGLDPDYVIYELEHNTLSYHIPQWTFLIKSGRGVYVVWKLRNEDGTIRQVRDRWSKMEKYLCDQLSSLGADTKATDMARVLRVPFSFNSKSGKQVVISSFCDVTYSLYELCSEYFPSLFTHDIRFASTPCHSAPTSRMLFCANAIAADLGIYVRFDSDSSYEEVSSFIASHKAHIKHSRYDSANARALADDIARLMSLRFGNESGSRETALFLYRVMMLRATLDSSVALSATLALNRTFSSPLDDAEVISSTKSADNYYLIYNYTRPAISSLLHVSRTEAQSLSLLPFFDNTSDNRRSVNPNLKKTQNRNYYLKKLSLTDDKPKHSKILDRREKLRSLVAKGCSFDVLMDALEVSRATLYRDLAALGLSIEDCGSDMDGHDDSAQDNKVSLRTAVAFYEKISNIKCSIIQKSFAPSFASFPFMSSRSWCVLDPQFLARSLSVLFASWCLGG